jgi:hypothetical protein
MNDQTERIPKGKTEDKKNEKSVDVDFWAILWFGFYFIVLTILFIYMVIKIWPGEGIETTINLFGLKPFYLGNEVRFILMVALVGALGSLIHAMTSFATYVGNKQFAGSWSWWFILRPFIGMPLALIFYFVVRGGFFTMAADTDAISPFGIAGLSGLVGMFSKQAIDKLREVFENLLRTEDDKRKNKLTGSSDQS